ncbi:MAG: hypothetical protein MI923_30245 [Phycisphaerales bacterium]|nr:hypothetical protein [Phycisphaerales bacterium]
MAEMNQRERIEELMKQILKGEKIEHLFSDSNSKGSILVRTIKASGDQRPDGLREDIDHDPGFSFAVAEASLEVDSTKLDQARLEAVHRILWEAGTDDWMDYSHLAVYEVKNIPVGDKLGLTFSSAHKGSRVIVDLMAAIGIIPEA